MLKIGLFVEFVKTVYGADVLDAHIKILRKTLGKYSGKIVTLRGVGYRFEG